MLIAVFGNFAAIGGAARVDRTSTVEIRHGHDLFFEVPNGCALLLTWILRLLPDPTSAHELGSVDSPKIAYVSLAAVGERAQSLQRTAAQKRAKVPSSGCRRHANGILAHVRTPGGPTGPTKQLFRPTRSTPTLCRRQSLTRSNRRGTDPYARWCGRGGAEKHPPIPINLHSYTQVAESYKVFITQ